MKNENKYWVEMITNILIGARRGYPTQGYLNNIIHNQRHMGSRAPITQEVLIALKETLDEKTIPHGK